MSTETVVPRYHFTVAQLEKMTDSAIGQLHTEALDSRAPDRYAKWHEALFFTSDPIYRENRVREERGLPAEVPKKSRNNASPAPAPEPEQTTYPTFAPSFRPQATGAFTHEQVRVISRSVGRFVRRKISEATAGLADASRLVEVMNRVDELERRATAAERRLANAEARFDAQSRHLRNLESKVTGGQVERSVKAKVAE